MPPQVGMSHKPCHQHPTGPRAEPWTTRTEIIIFTHIGGPLDDRVRPQRLGDLLPSCPHQRGFSSTSILTTPNPHQDMVFRPGRCPPSAPSPGSGFHWDLPPMLSDITLCSEDTWMGGCPTAHGGLVPRRTAWALMAQHYFGTKRGQLLNDDDPPASGHASADAGLGHGPSRVFTQGFQVNWPAPGRIKRSPACGETCPMRTAHHRCPTWAKAAAEEAAWWRISEAAQRSARAVRGLPAAHRPAGDHGRPQCPHTQVEKIHQHRPTTWRYHPSPFPHLQQAPTTV